jgi:hypothetical protein
VLRAESAQQDPETGRPVSKRAEHQGGRQYEIGMGMRPR